MGPPQSEEKQSSEGGGAGGALAAYLLGVATAGAVLIARKLQKKLRRRRRVVSARDLPSCYPLVWAGQELLVVSPTWPESLISPSDGVPPNAAARPPAPASAGCRQAAPLALTCLLWLQVGVLPARYQSSRFPGKPLVPILGKPMILRTYEQVGTGHAGAEPCSVLYPGVLGAGVWRSVPSSRLDRAPMGCWKVPHGWVAPENAGSCKAPVLHVNWQLRPPATAAQPPRQHRAVCTPQPHA